jgi:hypothetical protein
MEPWTLRPFDKTILTYVIASKLETLATEVLIQAGCEWPLALQGFPPCHQAVGASVMLVDFADDHDKVAKAMTRRRHRDYIGRAWAMAQLGSRTRPLL